MKQPKYSLVSLSRFTNRINCTNSKQRRCMFEEIATNLCKRLNGLNRGKYIFLFAPGCINMKKRVRLQVAAISTGNFLYTFGKHLNLARFISIQRNLLVSLSKIMSCQHDSQHMFPISPWPPFHREMLLHPSDLPQMNSDARQQIQL